MPNSVENCYVISKRTSSLTVPQLGAFGRVKNEYFDSSTPLIAQYSSSSPDAPETQTEPKMEPFLDFKRTPPGNGAILPPDISTMLTI